jgi:hypothetical protein
MGEWVCWCVATYTRNQEAENTLIKKRLQDVLAHREGPAWIYIYMQCKAMHPASAINNHAWEIDPSHS